MASPPRQLRELYESLREARRASIPPSAAIAWSSARRFSLPRLRVHGDEQVTGVLVSESRRRELRGPDGTGVDSFVVPI